jgi:hypothetical protein
MSANIDVKGPKLVTQSEYARSRQQRGLSGGSKQAVNQAVQAGRISTIGPDALIDPAVADIQWAQNSRGRVAAPRVAPAPQQAPGAALAGPQQALPGAEGAGALAEAPAAPVAPAAAGAPVDPSRATYQDARARREVADALRSELDVEKAAGRLVSKESMARGVHDAFQVLRDRIMAVPRSAAPGVVGMVDVREIELHMTRALREAFDGFEQQMLATIESRLRT